MVPANHPLARQPSVSSAALAREPFVFFDPHVGTGLYDDISACCAATATRRRLPVRWGGNDDYWSGGRRPGVSILPASFQRVQLSEMRWLPIDEQDAVSEMWLVWSKHHEQALAKRCEALLSRKRA